MGRLRFCSGLCCIPTFFVCFLITLITVFLSTFEPAIVNDVEIVGFNYSPPLSKRLVLISIDGLGHQLLLKFGQHRIAFLM